MKKRICLLTAMVVFLTGCGGSDKAGTTVSGEIVTSDPAINITVDDVTEESDDNVHKNAENSDNTGLAIEAYVTLLESVKKEESLARFALVYIDEDQIPELAIINSDAHVHGVDYYSFDGKDAVNVFTSGSHGIGFFEPEKGVMFGFWSGFGSTYTSVGVLNNGILEDEKQLRITNADLATPDQHGYSFAFISGDDEEETLISEKEYILEIDPYLPDNRSYRVLDYNNPMFSNTVYEIEDFKQVLTDMLQKADDAPKVDDEWSAWIHNGMIFPDDLLR